MTKPTNTRRRTNPYQTRAAAAWPWWVHPIIAIVIGVMIAVTAVAIAAS